jgi:hypothetical protein
MDGVETTQDQGAASEEVVEVTDIGALSPEQKREALAQAMMAQEAPESAEPEQTTEQEPQEDLAQKVARLEQELRQQHQRNSRQGNELGQARETMAKYQQQLRAAIEEEEAKGVTNILTEGYDAVDRRNELKAREQEATHRLNGIDAQIMAQETRQMIEQRLGGEVKEDLSQAVVDVLIEDGLDPNRVNASNIFEMDQALAVNVFERARYKMENAALKAELEQLRGRKTGDISKVLQQAAQSGGGRIGGKTGNASSNMELDPASIKALPLEEKRALLKEIELQQLRR